MVKSKQSMKVILEILSTTNDLDTIIVSFHRSNNTPYKAYNFQKKK